MAQNTKNTAVIDKEVAAQRCKLATDAISDATHMRGLPDAPQVKVVISQNWPGGVRYKLCCSPYATVATVSEGLSTFFGVPSGIELRHGYDAFGENETLAEFMAREKLDGQRAFTMHYSKDFA